jgi:large subunit ribosomal protein L31
MKKNIHPTFYSNAKIICACGNNFTIGSTIKEIHIEICSKCHPFYTGKQKLIDTARRVDRFKARLAKKETINKKTKNIKIKKQSISDTVSLPINRQSDENKKVAKIKPEKKIKKIEKK